MKNKYISLLESRLDDSKDQLNFTKNNQSLELVSDTNLLSDEDI